MGNTQPSKLPASWSEKKRERGRAWRPIFCFKGALILIDRHPTSHPGACPSRGFFCCDETLWTQASWGGKSLSGLHFHIVAHRQRKPGQRLKCDRSQEAGADEETVEGHCYWLAQYPVAFLSLLSYSVQDGHPRHGPAHSGLAHPHWSLTKKMPSRLVYSSILWKLLSEAFSLQQADLKLSRVRPHDLCGRVKTQTTLRAVPYRVSFSLTATIPVEQTGLTQSCTWHSNVCSGYWELLPFKF